MIHNSQHILNTTKLDRQLFGEVLDLTLKGWVQAENFEHVDRLNFECHSISLAISRIIPQLTCIHGLLIGMVKSECPDTKEQILRFAPTIHSWLLTPDGSVIDAYPVGFMSCNPVLVITRGQPSYSGGMFYKPDKNVGPKYITREIYRKSVVLEKLFR